MPQQNTRSSGEPQDGKYKSILGGFIKLAALWEEGSPAPLTFPSEVAARWYVRQHREHLLQAEALLYYGGRLFIHPERFEQAARRAGLEQAASRLSRRS